MSALICLTYDDALPVHREVVAPALTQRGLHGTFYIPAARDDLHEHFDAWGDVAGMGHELGNHSCFHPCRTRPDWDWKPPYRLEEYSRDRLRDELLLANRILQRVDGRQQRSYGATCSDLTCGPGEGEWFVDDLRGLFTIVRSGQSAQPTRGPLPFVVPALSADYRRSDEIIPVIAQMRAQPDACLVVAMHGVGAGTHHNFMDAEEHRRLVEWIAAQHSWLDAVTTLEAVHRRGCMLESG